MTRVLPITLLSGVSLLTIALSIVTVEVSPPTWQDEAQILSFGAGVFHSPQGEDYVLDDSGTPIPALCFAGAAMAYASWIALPGEFGHRYFMMTIALLSAFLLYKLCYKRLGHFSAMLFSLSWLFEPSLCQSYRGGRVDILALFLVLLAVAIWLNRNCSSNSFMRVMKIGCAGACLMLAELTWISTVLCVPFLFAVLYLEHSRSNRLVSSLMNDLAVFTVAGLALLGLAILAKPDFFSEAFTSTLAPSQNHVSFKPLTSSFSAFFGASKLSLATLGVAGMSFLVVKKKNEQLCLLIATIVTFLLVVSTRAYIHRFVYSLPILFLCVYMGSGANSTSVGFKRIATGMLAIVGVLISGLARNINALVHFEDRNYRSVEQAITSLGIASDESIYDGTWQLFLASKNKFTPIRYWEHTYGPSLDPKSNEMLQCDWIVLPKELPDSVAEALEHSGYSERIVNPKARAYGPYSIWHQQEND